MKPKSRTELRASVIDPLYRYLKEHDDLLEFESIQLNNALRLLVIADTHLAHLRLSHKQASKAFVCVSSDNDDLPF